MSSASPALGPVTISASRSSVSARSSSPTSQNSDARLGILRRAEERRHQAKSRSHSGEPRSARVFRRGSRSACGTAPCARSAPSASPRRRTAAGEPRTNSIHARATSRSGSCGGSASSSSAHSAGSTSDEKLRVAGFHERPKSWSPRTKTRRASFRAGSSPRASRIRNAAQPAESRPRSIASPRTTTNAPRPLSAAFARTASTAATSAGRSPCTSPTAA